jgi:surface antigen
MRKSILIASATALLLAGCAGVGETGEFGANKSTLGSVLGGLGGAAAGGALFGGRNGVIGQGSKTQLLGAVGGGLLGAMIGGGMGRSLDRADQVYAQRASHRAVAAPMGEQISWVNPDTGNRGTVMPVREGQSASGEYCREFQQTITVGGQTQQGYGTACRAPDGQWRVVQR